MNPAIAEGVLAVALVAGWMDLRIRRIPNWITFPSLGMGLASNISSGRWDGFTASLLGVLVGLGLLLPFILIRSLGTGDWKLAGALGAFTGPGLLIDLLVLSVFFAGAMAIILIIRRGRIRARRCATSATFWSRSSGSSCPAIACRWKIPSR